MSRTADERASAALLFSDELEAGTVDPGALAHPEVLRAVRSHRVWSWPRRFVERKRYERGGRGYADDSLPALRAARRVVLGDAAAGPARLLVRVDEFPNYDSLDVPAHGIDAYWRFHEVMRDAGVPYLVAVQPALAHQPLNPDATGGRPLDAAELAMLSRLRADGVAFAQHGYDHRTRTHHMPDNTELQGRSDEELGALLDRGIAFLAEHDVRPQVLVPPFNTFTARQWPVLAQRYAVVTGGPESVSRMGYHRTPLFRDGTVYAPCYQPLYGHARTILDVIEEPLARGDGVWMTITLHWEWELEDDFAALRTLLARIAPAVRPWADFLDAVERARGR